MPAFLRVSGVAAVLLSVAVADKMASGEAGHRRKHHHPALARVENKKQTSESDRFASIQQDLVEAWKERMHLEQLQHTIDSQKSLIGEQEKLVSSGSDAVSDDERDQLSMVSKMVKSSKSMMMKVRMASIKKIKSAMSAIMSIDDEAGKDIEKNKKRVEAAKAEIASATAASAKDEKIKQRSQKVLAAAVQEAKYFKNFVISGKGANETANSVTKTAQKDEVAWLQEEVKEEKAQQGEASKKKAHKKEHKEADADADDDWGKVDEDKSQEKESSQEKLQKEDSELFGEYDHVMKDES